MSECEVERSREMSREVEGEREDTQTHRHKHTIGQKEMQRVLGASKARHVAQVAPQRNSVAYFDDFFVRLLVNLCGGDGLNNIAEHNVQMLVIRLVEK